MMTISAQKKAQKEPLYRQLAAEYGDEIVDLILTVYINFYYSEIEIMNLCGKWIERRKNVTEKTYLVKHAHDEVRHAKMFKEGLERLGFDWDTIDHEKYRINDIGERFEKLLSSDDEIEVLIGLNVYAEGVLALEEIHQLANSRPDIFHDFDKIYNDEKTHLRFGVVVAKRMIEDGEVDLASAQRHCDWYEAHLRSYLDGELSDKINRAIEAGFVSSDYIDSTKQRFRDVMSEMGLSTTI